MRSTTIITLFALVLISALVAGCSSGSITDPAVDLARTLEGGGNGGGSGPGGGNGPGGGGGPHGPNGPWGDFDVDCVRGFGVDYAITMPNGYELDAPGFVKIFDNACDADESDVIVKFIINLFPGKCSGPQRLIPGTKTTTDEGLLYTGLVEHQKDWMHWGMELSFEYELLVSEEVREDGNVTVINGWLEHRMYHYWDPPDGEFKEKERIWHADITGVEITPEG